MWNTVKTVTEVLEMKKEIGSLMKNIYELKYGFIQLEITMEKSRDALELYKKQMTEEFTMIRAMLYDTFGQMHDIHDEALHHETRLWR